MASVKTALSPKSRERLKRMVKRGGNSSTRRIHADPAFTGREKKVSRPIDPKPVSAGPRKPVKPLRGMESYVDDYRKAKSEAGTTHRTPPRTPEKRPSGERLSTDVRKTYAERAKAMASQSEKEARRERHKAVAALTKKKGEAVKKTKESIYSAPKISKNQSGAGILRKVSNYATAHKMGTIERGAAKNKAGNASGLDTKRQRALAKGLSKRTTESSRKRLANRVLAAYGQKVK